MKRPVPFHPALFGMHPVLALYASNVSLVPLGDVWVPCAQTAVAALALWGLGWLVLRDAQRGAALSSALVFAFFTFGPLSDAVDPRGFGDPTLFLVSWSVLAVALAVLAAWKWKGERRLTLLLNATGSLMCLFAVVSIVSSHLAVNAQLRSLGRAGAIGAKAEGALPDIYYIILDGHGRGDVLQREFGVSSPTLEKELESRGFYVAESAHSNYMQTQISLASSLNFAYAQSLAKPLGSADRERKALDAAIDDNLASRTLKGLGYRTFAITTGFPALSFPNVDVHIQRDSGRTLFISALLQKTPVRFSDQVITSQFDSRRVALVGAFQAIKRRARRAQRQSSSLPTCSRRTRRLSLGRTARRAGPAGRTCCSTEAISLEWSGQSKSTGTPTATKPSTLKS